MTTCAAVVKVFNERGLVRFDVCVTRGYSVRHSSPSECLLYCGPAGNECKAFRYWNENFKHTGSVVRFIYAVTSKELRADFMRRQALLSKDCLSSFKPLPAFMGVRFIAVFTNPLHILTHTHTHTHTFTHMHTLVLRDTV